MARKGRADNRQRSKRKRAFDKAMRGASKRRDPRDMSWYGEAERRMCGSKVRYPNQAVAQEVAAQRILSGVPYLRAYHCDLCDGWHLTSKRPRQNTTYGVG